MYGQFKYVHWLEQGRLDKTMVQVSVEQVILMQFSFYEGLVGEAKKVGKVGLFQAILGPITMKLTKKTYIRLKMIN